MSFYLDANVLLSLFAADAHSTKADAWIDGDPGELFVSDFARVEFAAVMSRRLRAKAMSATVALETLSDFDVWTGRMAWPIETGAADMALAERLVRDFATKLSGPDALHLALSSNRGLRLVTFDERLAGAARMHGAAVVARS